MTVGFASAIVNGWLDGTFGTNWIKLHTADPGASGATAEHQHHPDRCRILPADGCRPAGRRPARHDDGRSRSWRSHTPS
jgi:hypothetical protein